MTRFLSIARAMSFAAVSLVSLNVFAQGTPVVSKPAGFVRAQVSASEQRLISLPFAPFNANVNALFSEQLTGAAEFANGDKIVKWNSATQAYITAFKAANTGDSNKDGKFFLDSTNWVPANMSLSPGEAFWAQNVHASAQNVYLFGKVPMDETIDVSLAPGMNLFAYPYTAKIGINSTSLKNDGAFGAATQNDNPDVINKVSPEASFWLKALANDPLDGKWLDASNVLATESLKIGSGYWFNRRGTGSFTWREGRPYTNIFANSGLPEISAVSLAANDGGVIVNISCSGIAGETLDIMYQDLSVDTSFVADGNWKIAARGVTTNSATSISWTDAGETGVRTAPNQSFGRVYAVCRGDFDADADGISDGVEAFVFKSNPNSSDSDGDGLTDGAEAFTHHSDPTKADTDGDTISDAAEINTYHTDPTKLDTDGDGLNDADEINVHHSDPNKGDTDEDGLDDKYEVEQGMDPNLAAIQGNGYKYELKIRSNGEDESTAGWTVFDNDPPGTIENVVDPDNASNRIIKLTGTRLTTGYKYTFAEKEQKQFKISWRMKFSESATINIDCDTTSGHRYLQYNSGYLHTLGSGETVTHGIGSATALGRWVSISRDLQRDLWDAQPNNRITAINAVLIRGSGMIDDLQTFAFADNDHDFAPREIEILTGSNPEDSDSDDDGYLDGDELNIYATNPVDAASKPMELTPFWLGTQDINPAAPGKTLCYGNNAAELWATASDLIGTVDGVRFLYQEVYGNCEVVARVARIEPMNLWTKAGVMIREDLNPGSKHATMFMSPNFGSQFQRRHVSGTSSTTGSSTERAPHWFKVTRVGDIMTGYRSDDGETWAKVAEERIKMSEHAYMGLALSSHNRTTQGMAVFDNVSIKKIAWAPEITPKGGTFRTTQQVTISSQLPGAEIRYTLDDSEPTASSALYTEPITVSGTNLVKAKVFCEGYEASPSKSALFTNEYVHGITARYYTGPQSPLSNMDSAVPFSMGVSRNINYSNNNGIFADSGLATRFGASFRGYLYVPESGSYTFYLSADDAARLFLDEQEVISGVFYYLDKSVTLDLTKGMHSIRTDMSQGTGGSRLTLQWEGAGISKQAIPALNFYLTDSDHDGLPDDWETFKHGNLSTSDGTADSDQDTYSDAEELCTFFTKMDDANSHPMTGVSPSGTLASGLTASYYKLTMFETPRFDTMTHYKTEIANDIYLASSTANLLNSGNADYVGAVFNGYLDVPTDGAYELTMKADDYATVYIDDVKVIEAGTVEKVASVPFKAGLHKIKIEFNELVDCYYLLLSWQPPDLGAKEPLPPARIFHSENELQALLESDDADGDGVSNATEALLGTNAFNSDSDGDGLSDFEENNIYHTDPMLADTDGDGVNDFEEAKSAFTNPLVADFTPGAISNALVVKGADATVALGQWIRGGTEIIAQSRRGILEYSVQVPQDDVYRLSIKAKENMTYSNEMDISIYVDGEFCGRRKFMSSNAQMEEINFFLPYLQAGSHNVKLLWDGYKNTTALRVETLTFQLLDGPDANADGVADWKTARVASMCSVDTASGEYAVSPVCVEGRDMHASMMQVTGGSPALKSSTSRWYSNVSLAQGAEATFQASFQNGVKTENRTYTWKSTNLLAANPAMTIRKGDSLLLGAWPEGATEGTFTVSTNAATLNGNAGTAVPVAFNQAGTQTVTAEYTLNGTTQSGSLVVTVMDYQFDAGEIVCMTNRTRTLDIPEVPDGVEIAMDPLHKYVTLQSDPPTGKTRYNVLIDSNEKRPIVARLANNGPILAGTYDKGMTIYSSKQTYVKLVETYEDGSKKYEMLTISSPVCPEATIELKIFVAGVTFDDGTLIKNLGPADFNELGEAKVYFIYPVGAYSSVCHTMTVFQGSVSIGGR